jgi:CheY-like chemotaxis protein
MQGFSVPRSQYASAGSRSHLLSPYSADFFFGQARNGIPGSPALAGTTTRVNHHKPQALIVDDVVDVTEMLAVFLGLAGYEVVTAHSAPEAIVEAESRHFDVVISDIGMPQMNGYELAERLRSIPGYEAVPMVAVTGFSMYDDRERSLRSGFNAHLTKPIDPNVLFQLIERLRG